MICSKCGAVNAETAFSCERCGAPLVQQLDFPTTNNPSGQSFASKTAGAASQRPTAASNLSELSLFAPIAHSPFSEEPLPQPSGTLPTLIQPSGDILVFTPTSEMATPMWGAGLNTTPPEQTIPGDAGVEGAAPSVSWDLADYPTETLQYPQTDRKEEKSQTSLPRTADGGHFTTQYPSKSSGFAPGGSLSNAQPIVQTPALPPSGARAQSAFTSALPPEVQGWQGNDLHQPGLPEESYASFFQMPPASQTPGNAYPNARDFAPTSQPLGNAYPGLPAAPGTNGNGTAPGQGFAASAADTPPTETHQFVYPLPRWALLAGTAAGALLLIALVFLNTDWASGATIASVVAIILVLLLLIAGGVRVALGLLSEENPHRRAQVISTISLVLLLLLFSGIGFSQQTGLHAMQARYLEGQHSWQAAISEYQAAGEAPPASANLARTYVEWGEALSSQKQYGSAVEKFSLVLRQYPQAAVQFGRARGDLVAAYLAWAASASQRQDYASATAHYDALLALSYCDPTCQTLAQPKDATAYDRLAEQQLARQQYAPAVAAFKTLTTRFASSPEAQQVHADYAQALWGLGQQQLHTTCANAIPTYQQLAKQFADTNQGQQAATALKQPVQARGRFTQSVPAAPFTPAAFLVQGLTVGIQQFQFPPLLRSAPSAPINSDGSFAFTSVPPGTYELVWSSDALHFYYAFNGNQVLYTAQIGPLCAYNFGDINQAIPTATGN